VAQKLGIVTIAELVENEATIATLREVGIEFAQGFGISRPRPLEE
jgi:EAL domain-containing protein (putative c-di-GMP-specific phosphodiesterase class I)